MRWYNRLETLALYFTAPIQELKTYANARGYEPFADWLNNLKDKMGRKQILNRIGRLEAGNFGDCKFLGDGIWELRVFHGPGYRVYLGKEGEQVVILLCGGDKKTQSKDIERAKEYWKEYQSCQET